MHEEGEEGLTRHLTKTGTLEQEITNMLHHESSNGYTNGKGEGSPV